MTKQESQLQKSLLSQEQVLELGEAQLKAVTGGSPPSEIVDAAMIATRKRTASQAGLPNFRPGGDKIRLVPGPNAKIPVPIFTVVEGKRIRP